MTTPVKDHAGSVGVMPEGTGEDKAGQEAQRGSYCGSRGQGWV